MADDQQPQRLTVNNFHKALVEAGVVRPGRGEGAEFIRRIVIDADVRKHVVVMHVERFGDDRMLNVVRSLDGIEVREEERPE